MFIKYNKLDINCVNTKKFDTKFDTQESNRVIIGATA